MAGGHAVQGVALFGFPLLDEITGGLETGDLAVFLGASGTGKSALIRSLVAAWRKQGLTQWLIDTQLHQTTTHLLLDALAAGVAPRDVRQDRLSDDQQRAVASWTDSPGKTGVMVRNDAARALRELADLEERPRSVTDGAGLPQILVVDELSGLANPHDFRASSESLQALKGFAVRSGVPVLLAVSAPREGEARTTWLETLGPFADKIVVTDGLLPSRHAKSQLTLIKNRKVAAITSAIEIGMAWSSELQTYRQASAGA